MILIMCTYALITLFLIQVRFQPLPLPARVPDSNEPIFGKNDMTNEMMAEHRRRAHELYKEQLNTVESRKRDAILKRLTDQQEEEDMLQRTKKEWVDQRIFYLRFGRG